MWTSRSVSVKKKSCATRRGVGGARGSFSNALRRPIIDRLSRRWDRKSAPPISCPIALRCVTLDTCRRWKPPRGRGVSILQDDPVVGFERNGERIVSVVTSTGSSRVAR